jgi:predicted Zn-dependent peptidase
MRAQSILPCHENKFDAFKQSRLVDWRVAPIHTEKTQIQFQAAAAMCVGVGSMADPEDAPGLAHFLGE